MISENLFKSLNEVPHSMSGTVHEQKSAGIIFSEYKKNNFNPLIQSYSTYLVDSIFELIFPIAFFLAALILNLLARKDFAMVSFLLGLLTYLTYAYPTVNLHSKFFITEHRNIINRIKSHKLAKPFKTKAIIIYSNYDSEQEEKEGIVQKYMNSFISKVFPEDKTNPYEIGKKLVLKFNIIICIVLLIVVADASIINLLASFLLIAYLIVYLFYIFEHIHFTSKKNPSKILASSLLLDVNNKLMHDVKVKNSDVYIVHTSTGYKDIKGINEFLKNYQFMEDDNIALLELNTIGSELVLSYENIQPDEKNKFYKALKNIVSHYNEPESNLNLFLTPDYKFHYEKISDHPFLSISGTNSGELTEKNIEHIVDLITKLVVKIDELEE